MEIKDIVSLILIIIFITNCLINIRNSITYNIKDVVKAKHDFELQSFILFILIILTLYI